MGGKRNRDRGFEFEREIVNEFKDIDDTCNRCWGSDGRSQNLPQNVDVVVDEQFHFQLKRQKAKFSKRYKPDDNIFAQIIRADYDEPYVIMKFSLFKKIMAFIIKLRPKFKDELS